MAVSHALLVNVSSQSLAAKSLQLSVSHLSPQSMVFLKKTIGFGHTGRMRRKPPSLAYTSAVILQGLLVPAEPFLSRATPEYLLHDAALLGIAAAW